MTFEYCYGLKIWNECIFFKEEKHQLIYKWLLYENLYYRLFIVETQSYSEEENWGSERINCSIFGVYPMISVYPIE